MLLIPPLLPVAWAQQPLPLLLLACPTRLAWLAACTCQAARAVASSSGREDRGITVQPLTCISMLAAFTAAAVIEVEILDVPAAKLALAGGDDGGNAAAASCMSASMLLAGAGSAAGAAAAVC